MNRVPNATGLELECARVLHKSLLVPVLIYGSEAMIWKEKERSRIRTVQMDNLRDFLVTKWVSFNLTTTFICESWGNDLF